ncbi:hypothetical protein NDU88_006168 [Pleurodeles waltl]|uniref:Uncharacterized protein n=1 Tax=Pleurodeles waltl TaxID=8319 RepID=A0AAV7TWC9_PLEWA|nr:hypothetical protein NDU88_006168 [Pleurodeles waltl]
MCRSTARSASRTTRTSETRQIQAPGETLGGRLRHWGRAALELRQVRRGSARIPLRGNPGRVSTGKAPGKESQEPDNATAHFSSPSSTEGGKTSKVVGAVGARGTAKLNTGKAPGKVSRESDNTVTRLSLSLNTGKISTAVGVPLTPCRGGGLDLGEIKRDKEVTGRQDKTKGKTSDLANCLFRIKKKGSEGRPGKKNNNNNKYRFAPSLRAYFKARPEDIVLVPGQGKMDTYMTKYTRNNADSGEGGMNDTPSLTNNLAHQVDKQAGFEVLLRQDGNLQEVGVVVETTTSPPPFLKPWPRPKT